MDARTARAVTVAVVGGGQSGLATSRYLKRRGIDHVVLDDGDGPGGAWTRTWPSLTLFSPASVSSLPGLRMHEPDSGGFPPVDHVVDYLAAYESRYELPVRRAVRVVGVAKRGAGFELALDDGSTLHSSHLVSATGTWSRPYVPHCPGRGRFAGRELHSARYRGPEEFARLDVGVVGGANSGAQIAADLIGVADDVRWFTRDRAAWLPDDIDGGDLFAQATARVEGSGEARGDYAELTGNVVAVPPVKRARDAGLLIDEPMFETLDDVADLDAIIWCTGFRPALRYLRDLDLRMTGDDASSRHPAIASSDSPWATRAADDPHLFFVGYGDWTGMASATLIGVGRTAKWTADAIASDVGA